MERDRWRTDRLIAASAVAAHRPTPTFATKRNRRRGPRCGRCVICKAYRCDGRAFLGPMKRPICLQLSTRFIYGGIILHLYKRTRLPHGMYLATADNDPTCVGKPRWSADAVVTTRIALFKVNLRWACRDLRLPADATHSCGPSIVLEFKWKSRPALPLFLSLLFFVLLSSLSAPERMSSFTPPSLKWIITRTACKLRIWHSSVAHGRTDADGRSEAGGAADGRSGAENHRGFSRDR